MAHLVGWVNRGRALWARVPGIQRRWHPHSVASVPIQVARAGRLQ